MTRDSQDPEKTSALTLENYNGHAAQFWEGTRDHDVSQNIAALLAYIEGAPPFMLLDFGCGPGRDLKAFAALGHVAIGLEGAAQLAAMARAHSGCEVWQQDFLALDLPAGRFDGVYANASLFHVPSRALPDVLCRLHACLKPAACCSLRTRAATTRKDGAAGATASTTISKAGAVTCPPRDSSNSPIITAPPACRANDSRGSRACGASLPVRKWSRRRSAAVSATSTPRKFMVAFI